ncbi:MAG: hypothetical protein ACKV2O_06650 [Acidimicrobiales bacterium]
MVLVVVLSVVTPSPVVAAAATEGIEMVLETGVRGSVVAGKDLPIRVTVTADRTTRGTIRLADPGLPDWLVVERDLALAAGTSKSFWMVLPGLREGSPATPTVTYSEKGRPLASVTSRFLIVDSVVGVLPHLAEAASPPPTVARPDGSGDAHLGTLSTEQMVLGAPGVDQFTAIAASGRDLATLSDTARAGLWQWLNGGGLLLVDDDPGAALPPAWMPGPAGYALAGAGEVRLTWGALARGEWEPFLLGASEGEGIGIAEQVPMQFFPGGVSTLARDAGLRLNRLGPMLAILVVYVALVGPVMFFVLKRTRRLTAGWVAIPIFAVVVTGLVVVVGNRSRMGAAAAHGTVSEVFAAGTQAFMSGLVVARSGGDHGFQLPPGWKPTLGGSPFQRFDNNRATHRSDGEGGSLITSLDSGQATRLNAVGPVATPPDQLSVEATSDADGAVTGTVRNNGPEALIDVAVFAGERAILIGMLPAGGSAPFGLADVTTAAGIAPVSQVWSSDAAFAFGGGGPIRAFEAPPMPTTTIAAGAAPGGGFPGPGATRPPQIPVMPLGVLSEVADVGLWVDAAVDNATLAYGSVRAVGWRKDTTAPLQLLGGGSIERGRSAITVAAPIKPQGRITDVTVRRKLTSVVMDAVGGNAANGQGMSFRFLLPPGERPPSTDFELAIPVGVAWAEAWNGGRWMELQPRDGVASLPSDTVRGGAILVRIDSPPGFPVAGLTVREAS